MNDFNGRTGSNPTAALVRKLKAYAGRPAVIMEVCGTHTAALFRHGIRDLVPAGVRLISGPGCPVCVTPGSFIDSAVRIAGQTGVIAATFGDLVRVPAGRNGPSLASARARGADVRVVYSPLDAVELAAAHPDRKVVFISCGFETTTPVAALAVLHAAGRGLCNFLILSANRTMPAVLAHLLRDPDTRISGYLYPGHVSAVTGMSLYRQLADEYGISGVVAGFEADELLLAITTLLDDLNASGPVVRNLYERVVREDGNPLAREKTAEVFEPCDTAWRGLGIIPGSGLRLREKYARFDAGKYFDAVPSPAADNPDGCRCGDVLRGVCEPPECGLFGKDCTPGTPAGACMVSSEGACAAHYRYGRRP